ncbi:MAG: patatin-like phospholipase family protein [Gammaproteobacteria bacterium]|nr:patatin-like phospholipase family protein [Gammaproteobacteria bacterium]
MTTRTHPNSDVNAHERPKPRIGLALGGGGARGWAHIGVIQALQEQGITPAVVSGCSMGAVIGAAYVSGRFDTLTKWACELHKWDVIRFFDVNPLQPGFIDERRLQIVFNQYIAPDDALIEDQEITFGMVTTRLDNGQEIWLQHGNILDSLWASIAIPGIFPPRKINDNWYMDGGMVNPVPVSLCRALGADIVIAVNLNHHVFSQQNMAKIQQVARQKEENEARSSEDPNLLDALSQKLKNYTSFFTSNEETSLFEPPKLFDTLAKSIDIMQDRITRSRMAGDPPEINLTPRLAHIGILEFFSAKDAIDIGRQCVESAAAEIKLVLP